MPKVMVCVLVSLQIVLLGGCRDAWEYYLDPEGPPRTFDGIKDLLSALDIEGLVYWFEGHPVAKIKKRDFGLSRSLQQSALKKWHQTGNHHGQN